MKKILVNFAHPVRARSNINRALRAAIEDIEGVTINDLYAHYPDFMIDIKREQALCEDHDIIVFQHPFFWYSTPAIMKEWLDLVLTHGWAYGSTGLALKDKVFFQALSAGGDASTYQTEGYNQFTLAELTSPYQATANLCYMKWIPPFAVTGVHRGLPQDTVAKHAADYRDIILAMRDDCFDYERAKGHDYINIDMACVRGEK